MATAPMHFHSTRGQCPSVPFSEAVAQGLAPDGGLYLPKSLPDVSGKLPAWEKLAYADLCYEFFRLFVDIPEAVLRRRVTNAYTRFAHDKVAPLVTLRKDLHVLELFHGPTLAFKDFALQLLGEFYEEQIARTGKPISVLGATSGDTGAAAIHGLLGKQGAKIFILYPDGRVSPLQERQMACTGADNVYALAVEGTFDDAQTALKAVFEDKEFRVGCNLAAVNSINISRVLAQCVYYFFAYFQLPVEARANVEVIVPTGNFGNIMAGWLAQKMGLPIRTLCIATNQNDILYRLFQNGEYAVSAVSPSVAPSMDIQVASNFERFIYFAEGRNPARVCSIMAEFKRTGRYVFPAFHRDTFTSTRVDDAGIVRLIRAVYQDFNYIADPHTACGFAGLYEEGRTTAPAADGVTRIVLATAHPAKFPATIQEAIGIEPTAPSLEALKALPLMKHFVAAEPKAIEAFILGKS
ncbi:MAG: threonine synthase [Verrucomicrobiota bacterium]|nr:threonine synthase [Verrucomicrobiota bacterium]